MALSKNTLYYVAHDMDEQMGGKLLDEILEYFSDIKEGDILSDIANTWDIDFYSLVNQYED